MALPPSGGPAGGVHQGHAGELREDPGGDERAGSRRGARLARRVDQPRRARHLGHDFRVEEPRRGDHAALRQRQSGAEKLREAYWDERGPPSSLTRAWPVTIPSLTPTRSAQGCCAPQSYLYSQTCEPPIT